MKRIAMPRNLAAGLAFAAASLLAPQGHAQDPNFHIYLAFGQSNMEGYPGNIEAQDQTVNARFKMMAAVDWPDKSRVKGTWYTATPPLCRNSTGLNPCDYFGRTLADSLPATVKIGIINVAVAGCAIEMFDKDKYKTYVAGQASWLQDIANGYGGSPYARLVEMAKLAQKDGVIRGFLMHQGESGSSTGQWANEVKIVYNNLIQDLGLDPAKTPLLAGDLVRPSTMVQGLPKTLPNSYVIATTGLSDRGDGLHFDAKSYRELGKRYAIQMLSIYAKTSGLRGTASPAGYTLGAPMAGNGMATLEFGIPRRAFVTLKAYTAGGREIADLASGDFDAGRHEIRIGGKALPDGMCILRMRADGFTGAQKLMVGAP
jgi:hypothetical protein